MKKVSLAICLGILLSQPCLANQDINSEFNETYRAYLAALENQQDTTELRKKPINSVKKCMAKTPTIQRI